MLSIAPMIQWTDRHYRVMMRQLTKETTLYTEMTMDTALIYNEHNLNDYIGYSPEEQPLVVQVGGSEPNKVARAAKICDNFGGFSEINLNAGCPSTKAKRGGFGAELMIDPQSTRQIVYEMKREVTKTDVTVKCRIGVTPGRHSWENLVEFVDAIRSTGVNKMIVHARVCMLHGLTPAQNRTIPPLQYEVVDQLVKAFPDMKFVLNGGVTTFDAVEQHLSLPSNPHPLSNLPLPSNISNLVDSGVDASEGSNVQQHQPLADHIVSAVPNIETSTPRCFSVTEEEDRSPGVFCFSSAGVNRGDVHTHLSDPPQPDTQAQLYGVMIGREAYNNPWLLADADRRFFHKERNPGLSRGEVVQYYLDYANRMQELGVYGSSTPNIVKPLHNFFAGCETNRKYKQKLDTLLKSEEYKGKGIPVKDIVELAIEDTIPRSFLDVRIVDIAR